MVLRIEHVSWKTQRRESSKPNEESRLSVSATARKSSTARYLHLVVSDGELQVQAIFVPLSNARNSISLHNGGIIVVRKFSVRKAPRSNGQGHVIYLSVEEFVWIGSKREATDEAELESEGGFIREDVDGGNQHAVYHGIAGANIYRKPPPVRLAEASFSMDSPRNRKTGVTTGESTGVRAPPQRRHVHQQSKLRETDTAPDDEEDSFDTLAVSQSQIENRREALRQISQHKSAHTPAHSSLYYYSEGAGDNEDHDDEEEEDQDEEEEPKEGPFPPPAEKYVPLFPYVKSGNRKPTQTNTVTDHNPAMMERPLHSSVSLPIHTLASLLDSKSNLPRRSYACSVLAVISWVSPSLIYKPNTPFPPKRHIKIHDQTISDRQAGITVAVFVDAKDFMPAIGTVALLRGVVMQKFGEDVILNKYTTHPNPPGTIMEKPCDDKDWFVTDERILNDLGFDSTSLKTWWDERVRKRENSASLK
ncbi:hypothetical protein PV08_00219 [Exophiala spinifera]|uniref:Uncharacterized protein n=1 Tax=Exophiala spinifera TaxID=91928 RepID=A0A0D2BM26_9EURO|nr:uncharacterized protein PV08_00219 [Exophiala spinifera]KIW19645.1 hypothetical protein PV08_00219 [Exophiala spinifera]